MKTRSFAPALPVPQVQLRLCPCELARLCCRAQGQRLARHLHSQLVRAQSPLDRGLDTVTEGETHGCFARNLACPLLLTPTRAALPMLLPVLYPASAGGVKNATLRFDLPPPAVAVRNLVCPAVSTPVSASLRLLLPSACEALCWLRSC